ncbi:hypothetical protein FRC02_004418, partial [Tulasnella sp. 418]
MLQVTFVPHQLRQLLEPVVRAKEEANRTKVNRQRRRAEPEERAAQPGLTGAEREPHDPAKFMALPTCAEKKECHRQFLSATSNKALESSICASCAREFFRSEVTEVELDRIPHQHLLHPWKVHPAHQLTQGMLLEPAGIVESDMGGSAYLCSSCLQ